RMGIEHRLHARCGGGHHDHGHHDHGHREREQERGGGRPFAFATSPRHFERDRPFAVDDLALDLVLAFDTRSIEGTATLTLRRIDPEATSIALDAVAFTIKEVTVDGRRASHAYDGRVLTVPIPPRLEHGTLSVTYEATPRRGLYFLEPDEHVPGRPRQAWTQC